MIWSDRTVEAHLDERDSDSDSSDGGHVGNDDLLEGVETALRVDDLGDLREKRSL